MCFTSGMRGSAGGLGGPGTAWALEDPMATLTPDTPGSWPTTLRAWLWISTFATAGCVVNSRVNDTCPPWIASPLTSPRLTMSFWRDGS